MAKLAQATVNHQKTRSCSDCEELKNRDKVKGKICF